MSGRQHYAKPWLSIDEQIALVESRGMTDAHEYAMEFARIGYYRLSGYWYPFRKVDASTRKRCDEFIDDARFEHVIRLYRYDDRLRSTLYSALSKIEIALRVKVGYILGHRDPFIYLKPAMLRDDLNVVSYANFISSFTREVNRSDEDFTEHFRQDYDGKMPIWTATETMTIGNLCALILCAKPEDFDDIADDFGISRGALHSWLPVLKDLRNAVAHQTRLFDKEFDVNPNWDQRPELVHVKEANAMFAHRREQVARANWDAYRELQRAKKTNKIYGMIALVAYMLRNLDDNEEAKALKRCLEAFPTDIPGMSPSQTMGIPDHWKEQVLWQFTDKS